MYKKKLRKKKDCAYKMKIRLTHIYILKLKYMKT